MKLLGWTGGIGMGKSTSASFLKEKGLPVVDTDLLAREIVQPGESALREIVETFGEDVLDGSGELNRAALAKLVFQDENKRRTLESILHPRIRQLWQEQAAAWEAAGQPLGVVIIPLLFETSAHKEFQNIICVACSEATQRGRLAARGWTNQEIEGRMAAQWPVSQKMAESDFVVWTEGSLGAHEAQIDLVLERCAA